MQCAAGSSFARRLRVQLKDLGRNQLIKLHVPRSSFLAFGVAEKLYALRTRGAFLQQPADPAGKARRAQSERLDPERKLAQRQLAG